MVRNTFIEQTARYRVLYHILFWVIYYLYYVAQYKFINTSYEDWQWAVSLSVTIWPDVLATYFTAYYLLPKFLLKEKYFSFGAIFLVSAAFFILLQRILVVYVVFPVIEPEYAETVNFWNINPFYTFINIYSIVGLFTAIKLLKFWYREQELRNELEQQNKSSELAMLRSQVNPHFLFNTLNNIDSLIMIDREKASDAIIKLSDIMRYMLYDSNTELVDLQKEVTYLRSYISLQRMRIKNPSFITFNLDGDCHGLKIAPMLFIPFVENAFKHGKKTGDSPGILINLSCNSSRVVFEVENFVEKEETLNKDRTQGIGLSNIERRLALIYPERHQLSIRQEKGKYIVSLTIFVK